MGQRVHIPGMLKYLAKAERKRVLKGRKFKKSLLYVTRNQVIYPWADWIIGNTILKIEPTPVAKGGDDLWVGVKGESNLDIAGSPRKLLR